MFKVKCEDPWIGLFSSLLYLQQVSQILFEYIDGSNFKRLDEKLVKSILALDSIKENLPVGLQSWLVNGMNVFNTDQNLDEPYQTCQIR